MASTKKVLLWMFVFVPAGIIGIVLLVAVFGAVFGGPSAEEKARFDSLMTHDPAFRDSVEQARATRDSIKQAKKEARAQEKAEEERLARDPLAGEGTMAGIIAEDFVEGRLKFPKTADFSMFSKKDAYLGDGRYDCRGEVEAQNAFGVPSDYVYRAILRYKGGESSDIRNWELVDISLSEKR